MVCCSSCFPAFYCPFRDLRGAFRGEGGGEAWAHHVVMRETDAATAATAERTTRLARSFGWPHHAFHERSAGLPIVCRSIGVCALARPLCYPSRLIRDVRSGGSVLPLIMLTIHVSSISVCCSGAAEKAEPVPVPVYCSGAVAKAETSTSIFEAV